VSPEDRMATEIFPSSRDVQAFKKLKRDIRTGEVVAFVGAGLSVRTGFANWDQLLGTLGATAQHDGRQAVGTDDLSWHAELLRKKLRPKAYQRFLEEYFGRKPKEDVAVANFSRLAFRHIFTTNYDRSIERALKRLGRPFRRINWQLEGEASEVIRSFATKPSRDLVLVYLHGRYDKPGEIVLSERDYRRTYVRSDETIRKLFAIFSMKKVAFFGFSLRDPDVLSIFRQVMAANARAQHFAVLPDEGTDRSHQRLRLINKFGIHPVFYRPGDRVHSNFASLIAELAGVKPTRAVPARPVKPGTWAARPEFRKDRGRVDPSDPQKGRFGGSSTSNGRRLRARVSPERGAGGWYDLKLEVSSISAKPLRGKVDLWVHDSFPREHYYTFARRGVAKFSFSVYGAFTVGATCDRGMTPLELDLARIKTAPREFRSA
jgi:hypothetical protein